MRSCASITVGYRGSADDVAAKMRSILVSDAQAIGEAGACHRTTARAEREQRVGATVVPTAAARHAGRSRAAARIAARGAGPGSPARAGVAERQLADGQLAAGREAMRRVKVPPPIDQRTRPARSRAGGRWSLAKRSIDCIIRAYDCSPPAL